MPIRINPCDKCIHNRICWKYDKFRSYLHTAMNHIVSELETIYRDKGDYERKVEDEVELTLTFKCEDYLERK